MVCLSVFLNWVALLVLIGINVTSIFNEIVNQLGKYGNIIILFLFIFGHIKGILSFTC